MFRTASRGTHRATGRAVIDYRGLAVPVGKGVGGVAVLGAVTATGALQSAPSAQAAPAPAASTVRSAVTAPVAAPATSSSYSSVKLRLGARGDAVKSLQRSLNDQGAGISADGVFGSRTLRAVKSAQSSAGIAVDGVVGPQTWAALNGSEKKGASSSSSSGSSSSLLRQGSRGSAVRTLQSSLNEAGANLKVDGVFGRGTASAVRSLQSAAGLRVDTVVGPKTWSALDRGVRIGSTGSDRGTSRDEVGSSFDGQAIVSAARAQIGVGYKWGGSSPSTGFDCSGLVYHAYNQAGIDLSRKTAKGYTFGGRIISQSEAKVGDLVAFTGNDYGHIGIYAGNGTIIDASGSRQRVMERSIWSAPHVFVTYR